MIYRITPANKKSVTETEIWTKDGMESRHSIGWRWGAVFVAEKPDLSKYDPEVGIDVWNSGWDAELDSCDDGCWDEWNHDEQMSAEDIEEFEAAYEEDWSSGIEELGWSNDETELWFFGELEITELE